ncbi:amidohydrolase [Aestuariicella hydrocarbonica]|uniref:Omega-amidase YafV n=1 Tax=Pseudomaricurvus hydrocarbonicus TaxID=1470433 RepID=A0A9E5MMW3_9GAMM|nr:amidohydrolase [Aestuariicella hydrocarbonica]NHO67162.1 amidohydrolase [Aestuariicella hydrocarbonica]
MPKQDLRVSIIQQSLVWQDPPANRARFGELILGQAGATDLIVLPEMFTAGFSMDSQKVAEPATGETLAWMKEMAQSTGAVITGSYAVAAKDGGLPLNRLVWMRPDASYEIYDKRHLFRMAGEHKRYQAGEGRLTVELMGWRIRPLICYDLRFPVWCRNQEDYDLLIFVANWPAARAYPWSQLLKARAIENLACVVGVNRVGEDGNGHAYSGDSVVLDAMGKPVVDPGSKAGVFTVTLSAEALNSFREKFPAHLDADGFQLT